MSWIQRFLHKHFPESAKALEAESRQWMLQCPNCGHEVSYWDIGGIRGGGFSKGKRTWIRCRNCHKWVGHRVYRKKSTVAGEATIPPTES
jgi:hypothetical protein